MARTGLWKVRSGRFAGWRDEDQLYDTHGCHVGYFRADVAYNLQGEYMGEIYRDDWIGKKELTKHGAADMVCSLDSITAVSLPDREGIAADGWADPDL